jgi:hypothetical protein
VEDATKAASPQLDYAPPPPVYRRRSFRRALGLVIVSLVIWGGVRWGPPVVGRARLLYAQRQCQLYVAPQGQVICAEPLPYGGQTPPFTMAAPDPDCLQSFRAPPVVPSAGPGTGGPVLFLHERRSKSGVRRLIILRRTPPGRRMSWDIPLSFNVTLVEPVGWSGIVRAQSFDLTDAVPSAFGDGTANAPLLRFFAGQPDPQDESHFTIDYELEGIRGTIDGWLRDSQFAAEPVRVELGQR